MVRVSSDRQTLHRLSALLDERDMNQRDLVAALHKRGLKTPESHVSRICSGYRPGMTLRDAIAVVLEVEEAEIWG